MTAYNKDIVKELVSLNRATVRNLRTKGYVPPVRTSEGKIKVGSYIIDKDDQGLYFITDDCKNIVVAQINLPQSAAMVANKLALGIRTDKEILTFDTYYGNYVFDEQNCQNLLKKCKRHQKDKAEIILEKLQNARARKKFYYNKIIQGFTKLIRIV